MRRMLRHWQALAAVLSVGGLVACGGDTSTAPSAPTAIQISAGDGQSVAQGLTVPVAPSVLVTDAHNNPVAGVAVTFEVASGGGALTGGSAATNASGIAAVGGWTLGMTPGSNTLTATVSGIAPVTFSATALDPCTLSTAYTFGTTATGELSMVDCTLTTGGFIDYLSASTSTTRSLVLRMNADSLDTFLYLQDGSGNILAFNDDSSDTNLNSALRVIVGPGSYFLGASSFASAETGAYTLSSTATSEDIANCETVWIVPGVTTTQRVKTTDCASADGLDHGDLPSIRLRAGQTITVSVSSTDFDAYVHIQDGDYNSVADDDNSGGGTNARLTYTAPADGDYYIFAAAANSGTGAYVLSVQ